MTRRAAVSAALVTASVLVPPPIRLIARDGLKTVPYRFRIQTVPHLLGTPIRPIGQHGLEAIPTPVAIPIPVGDGLQTVPHVAYLMLDATTGVSVAMHWDDPGHPLPVGTLIKPFTALAYAGAHRFTYPTSVCHGAADGCWLPAGHGRIGIVEAIAGSCNAYFHQLSQSTSPDAFASTLQSYGMATNGATITPRAMVGLGDGLRLAPAQVAGAYVELIARASQPGVSLILQGMKASARTGTGRAAGPAVGGAGGLVKTGTAPCVHSPAAGGDGYAIVIYPADRPRVVLLVQAHGRTGAETAGIAGNVITALDGR